MAFKDFVTGRTNKIVIGGASGVGLIIAAIAGLSYVRPAVQIEQPDGDVLLTFSDHGAIGVKNGSGVSFGSVDDCLKSGGSSGSTMTFGTCGSGAGGGDLSGTGSSTKVAYFTGQKTLSGSDMFWDDSLGSLTLQAAGGNATKQVVLTHNGTDASISPVSGIMKIGFINNGRLAFFNTQTGEHYVEFNQAAGLKLYTGYPLLWGATTAGHAADTGIVRKQAGVITATNGSTGLGQLWGSTLSGHILKARDSLASSGTLVWEGTASGNNLNVMGKVGIGKASPSTKVDVVGTISGSLITQNGAGTNHFLGSVVIGKTSALAQLHVYQPAAGPATLDLQRSGSITTGTFGSIIFRNSVDNSLVSILGVADGGNTQGGITFNTRNIPNGDAGPIERMRILSSGNIGIGTSSPTATLDVLGTISGSILKAKNSLNSSGSLVWEETASGKTLHVMDAVGIGTASPSGKLYVRGTFASAPLLTLKATADAGTSPCIVQFLTSSNGTMFCIKENNPNSAGIMSGVERIDGLATISLSSSSNGASAAINVGSSNLTIGYVSTGTAHTFINSFSYPLILNGPDDGPTRSVGIATTTPGSKLSVSGAVIINANGNLSSGAADAGVALEIIGTASGRVLRAQDTLASSGSAIIESNITMGGDISLHDGGTITAGNFTLDLIGGGKVIELDSVGLRSNAPGTTDLGRQTLRWQDIYGTSVDIAGTMSGHSLRVRDSLSSSGTLVWEGTGSGNELFIQKNLSVSGAVISEGTGTFGAPVRATTGIYTRQTAGGDGAGFANTSGNTYILGRTSNGVSVDGGTEILTWESNSRGLGIYGPLIVNEAGLDSDIRFEGDNDQGLFFLDASTDRVGIGTQTPKAKLDVNGAMSGASLYVQGIRISTGSTVPVATAITTKVITNTATETAMGKTYTIPANTIRPGDTFMITAAGTGTAAGGGMGNFNFFVKVGSTRASGAAPSGAITFNTPDVSQWHTVGYLTFRSIGASGNIRSHFVYNDECGIVCTQVNNGTGAVINTTTDLTLNMNAQWQNADPSNSISILEYQVVKLATLQ